MENLPLTGVREGCSRHINPDGTAGGWVLEGVELPSDVYIDVTSIVLSSDGIASGDKIGPHEIYPH